MIQPNKKLIIPVFLGVVFVVAIIVWYSPIIFKGYSFQPISQEMLLAKNYHESGIFATQNNQSVVVSSNLTKNDSYQLPISKYFGSVIFAKIFDVIGVPGYNLLVLLSIILYAIVLVVFTILTMRLFGLKIAGIFSLVYIFSPLGWGLSYNLGIYEFCLLFMGISLIFYFLGTKKEQESKFKISILFFVVSGSFLGLAALSKEIALVFALALFIFMLIKKLKKQLLFEFIPFIVLLMIFWFPSFLSGENKNLSLITGKQVKINTSIAELHVFPDAYTYYFEKEAFLEKFKNQDLGLSENIEIQKALTNNGFLKIGVLSRLKIGIYILTQHLFRFISLQDFGGPLITLLLILGFIYLRRKNKFIFNLFVYWLVISLVVFCFIVLVSRNHMMDFVWPLILLVSLGAIFAFKSLYKFLELKGKKGIIFSLVALVLLVYQLFLTNHVVLGEIYDNEFLPKTMAYVREINKVEIKNGGDVIAIPGDIPGQDFSLAYLTNKSFVIFRTETLEKLLKEDKTDMAFEEFKVKYILGYSDLLSNKITKETKAINIASDSLNIEIEKISETKSFLMNLFR